MVECLVSWVLGFCDIRKVTTGFYWRRYRIGIMKIESLENCFNILILGEGYAVLFRVSCNFHSKEEVCRPKVHEWELLSQLLLGHENICVSTNS